MHKMSIDRILAPKDGEVEFQKLRFPKYTACTSKYIFESKITHYCNKMIPFVSEESHSIA